MGGILVDVLSAEGRGAEVTYPRGLTLVSVCGERVVGPFDPTPERPAVMIVAKHFSFGDYLVAVLVHDTPDDAGYQPVKRPGHAGPMMNGRFIWTSDGRFNTALGEIAGGRPVPLHDRWESHREQGISGQLSGLRQS